MVRTHLALAAEQHGLVTRDQLIGLGIGEDAIDYGLSVGALERVHPRVYRVAGAPPSWEQSLLATQLAAGETGIISHLAAGRVYKLEGVECDRPHVLLPHGRRLELDGVVVHRTRVLPDGDVRRRGSLRVTTPARTLVDLAGVLSLDALERALDDALRRRIVTLRQIRRCLDQRGPNGVKGWARLDRLVRERVGTEPTGSGKETRFLRGLRKRRLPVPIKQLRIVDDRGRFVARPDFAYADLRIAIEIDSGFHLNPTKRRADLRRQNAMSRAGWRVLYFDRTDRSSQLEAFATIEAAFAASRL